MLNPNCSELVVRIDTSKLVSNRATKLILEHFEDTKAYYEDEASENEWFAYLLKYMKLKKNKESGETIVYCSRFEGEDDFFMDLHDVIFLYDNNDLIEAKEKGKVLPTNIKGTRRW